MALRIVEAHLSAELVDEARDSVRELVRESWTEPGGRHGAVLRAVTGAESTGAVLDRLHEQFGPRGELLVLVQPLEGMLPRPFASATPDARAAARTAAAVSREEVYANIADTAKLNQGYLVLVVLATVVAGIGLVRDNAAAVIGAMVVAPLLGPNMALALGIVLGDRPLVRRALVTNAAGFALALASAAVLGLALDADLTTPELVARTRVGLWDLVLALAAGCAGSLAYTSGAPTYLTGVMVAVALLPPAVASGIFLAHGQPVAASAAVLLAGGNLVALTLASMLTFLWRGMRPRNWWMEESARRTARTGVAIFLLLLVALGGLIVLSQRLTGS